MEASTSESKITTTFSFNAFGVFSIKFLSCKSVNRKKYLIYFGFSNICFAV